MKVMVKIKCPECKGEGIVAQQDWVDFYREHPGPIPKGSNLLNEFFQKRGYMVPPPEEILCLECEGDGWVQEDLDMAHFVREIAKAMGGAL